MRTVTVGAAMRTRIPSGPVFPAEAAAVSGVSAATVHELRGQPVRMPRMTCVPRSLPNPACR